MKKIIGIVVIVIVTLVVRGIVVDKLTGEADPREKISEKSKKSLEITGEKNKVPAAILNTKKKAERDQYVATKNEIPEYVEPLTRKEEIEIEVRKKNWEKTLERRAQEEIEKKSKEYDELMNEGDMEEIIIIQTNPDSEIKLHPITLQKIDVVETEQEEEDRSGEVLV